MQAACRKADNCPLSLESAGGENNREQTLTLAEDDGVRSRCFPPISVNTRITIAMGDSNAPGACSFMIVRRNLCQLFEGHRIESFLECCRVDVRFNCRGVFWDLSDI